MLHRKPMRAGRNLAGLALLVLCAASPAHAAVRVALMPPTQTVTPGSDFNVFVEVTEAGSSFNGFDFVVGYNPAALTFVPLSPVGSQQGCLMTGSCSGACGQTFHVFTAAGDSLSVSDVLLCNQFSLTGPGQVYKLRFHASTTAQVTNVTFRRRNFYNAGLFVNPVLSANCQIGIGVNLGVDDRGGSRGRVRIEPNPSRGRVEFVTDGSGAEVTSVDVLDLQGRLVCRLGSAGSARGSALGWDGTDSKGARVPAGVYLALVRRQGAVERHRVVLLP